MKLHIDPRKKAAIIPVDILREHVGYNPKTGNLWWKKQTRGRTLFAPFGRDSKTPYIQFGFERRILFAHRAAFAIYHGYWTAEVDHKNHNTRDNRICNLRAVTRSQNSMNQGKLHRLNKSGIAGVRWNPLGFWEALLRANNVQYRKKCSSKLEAIRLRRAWKKEHHREFAGSV